jgi:predicted permease
MLWDVRYAIRLLSRQPLFALTAALSLSVGIGATTTIFTIANGLLLRSAPGVRNPDRLVDVFRTRAGNFGINPVSYLDYLDIRQRTTTLDGIYAYRLEPTPMTLGDQGEAEGVFANFVTTNYFSVLGVRAAAGRVFGASDSEAPGESPIAVLSHSFWTRRFNADPAAVGRTVPVNGHPVVIVGVAAEPFAGTTVAAPDLWLPATMIGSLIPGTSRRDPGLMTRAAETFAIGARLNPNVSIDEAEAEAGQIARDLEREYPAENRGRGLRLTRSSPIPAELRPIAAAFLALLMGIVLLVLMIACANVSGVLLSRAVARRREIAVRVAIGAGRARLVRQLLTETMMPFVLGGLIGVILARAMTSALLSILPAFPIPVNVSLPLDMRVLTFAAVVSLGSAVLSGLAPALHASKADVASALKDDSQSPSDRLRLRSAFVVAQVVFSIVLVVTAGLLVRALRASANVDQGFDPQGVEVASFDLSTASYTEPAGLGFAIELIERIRQLPGVESAALADGLPMRRSATFIPGDLTIPGVVPPDGQTSFMAAWNVVTPGYFNTLRIPMLAGRDFTDRDRAGAQPVAIVDDATARRYWPGEDAIGKYLVWRPRAGGEQNNNSAGETVRLLVVGVVRGSPLAARANVVERSRNGRGAAGDAVRMMAPLVIYVPLQQRYTAALEIFVRTAEGRRSAPEIRTLVASMDPRLAILTTHALGDQSGPVQTQLRIAASVAASLGFVGLLLAAVGIYGVTAYTVARRTREIGVRMALGAEPGDILRMVLEQAMRLVAVGCVIGLLLAAASTRLLTRLLFGVPPLDPATFIGTAAVFALIGLLASYLPVRRAVRINAVDALRYE